MIMNKTRTQGILDHAAISTSVLCMVHCLATPLLLVAVPILSSSFLADEAFHKALVTLVLPTSLIAIFIGCGRHKDRYVLYLGCFGLVSLVFIAFFGHDLLGEVGEKVATVGSGAILAFAHLRNFRLCRRFQCDA